MAFTVRPATSADLKPGSRRCLCRGCGLLFAARTPFDLHQRVRPFRCLPPASVGLASTVKGEIEIWGQPGKWAPVEARAAS